ncbi:hypothetical protein EGW08_002064, partial [Elysia chlorotica]
MAGQVDIKDFLRSTFTDLDSNLLASEAKCKDFMSFYGGLVSDKRGSFLGELAETYGFNSQKCMALAAESGQGDGEAALLTMADKLRVSLQPRYRLLFTLVGRVDGGLQFLVNLRADVLGLTRQRSNTAVEAALFQELNVCLRELLTLWFSPGFLDVQRVTWDSPCELVQQVCKFEAVHPVASWQDIKRRVGTNRRVFAFTHRAMPNVPVVVLHVGLAPKISASLHSLLEKPSLCDSDTTAAGKGGGQAKEEREDPTNTHAAVFYSITSTQKG